MSPAHRHVINDNSFATSKRATSEQYANALEKILNMKPLPREVFECYDRHVGCEPFATSDHQGAAVFAS